MPPVSLAIVLWVASGHNGRHSASIPPALTIVPGGTVLYPVAVPAFFLLYSESIESIVKHWSSVEECVS